MVYELERVLRGVMAFSAACERHMMVQYCCGSGSTNNLFCRCFLLLQEPNSYSYSYMTLEGARLLELHSSVSIASEVSHHE